MPASQESPAGPAPSVLLVEEYDALAAAIASALKKFAPTHQVRVVESLTEAEASILENTPRLLIVDFDPPRLDAIEFLDRITTANSDARMLAIASGVPAEMNAEGPGPKAIHFIEKPFELAEFGAAVQALLGPWTDAKSGDSRGTLRNLGVRDLIPLQCLNLATAVLRLRSEDERSGEIHFVDGQMIHAATGNFTGVGAVHQMIRWQNPRIRETERVLGAPRTIHGSWHPIFLDAVRNAPIPAAEETPVAPPPAKISPPKPAPPPEPPGKTGKKIVVIDDTEMLLIFVEDSLCAADPQLQIVTAFTGSEGLRRAEVFQPDLVLLDYSLPDLCGDQVCERLLQNQATARIPVVMMSGHVSEMAATARKYRNVRATIEKPFMSDALILLVKEALAKGPLSAERERPKDKGEKPAKKNGDRPAAPVPESPVFAEAGPAPPPSPPAPEIAKPVIVPTPAVPLTPRVVAAAPPSPLIAPNGSTVILGLGMEVLAVQFTPRFTIGTLRARPTFSTLSLRHSSTPGENLLAGFEVGPVELDETGRIRTMRVLPTRRPVTPVAVQSRLEIKEVALVNQNASIQLTAGQAAPMTMEMIAVFKVAAVELSDRFEVAQLVLESAGRRVRVSLEPRSQAGGTEFETVGVRLDSSRRIVEFFLRAVPVAAVV